VVLAPDGNLPLQPGGKVDKGRTFLQEKLEFRDLRVEQHLSFWR
jgi:hypothetical protein